MSAKGYLISLSLAGSAAALACWLWTGETAPVVLPGKHPNHPTKIAPISKTTTAPASLKAVSAATPQKAKAPSAPPAASQPLTTEELTARAAKVEQEANHDLRRLVKLLDLNEAQQDQVFQTLAQHSPSWTPGMQAAASAATAGKRSKSLDVVPGLYSAVPIPETKVPATSPAPTTTVADNATAKRSDPLDEVMALLNPDQQNTLLQEEMDRTAWWAEVLEQITPADDVPGIDGTTPATGAGETKAYEGSDVLE